MTKRISLSYKRDDLFSDIGIGSLPAGSPGMPFAGISLAAAGDMSLSKRDVVSCRSDFFRAIGWADADVYAVRQTHSKTIVVVDGGEPDTYCMVEADGLLSSHAPRLLTVTVADCLPIFLADPATGAFGIVHSGWRGTGIVEAAVRRMRLEFGALPERLAVTIGPGIGACCYDVSRERYEDFLSRFGAHAVRREGDRFFLDLRAANEAILAEAGVRDIAMVEDCTRCTPSLGSYRRQGPREFTPMLAFIGHRPPGAGTVETVEADAGLL